MLVYRLYDLLKDKLDYEQIIRIVSFLLHFTQHPLMTSAYFKYRILSYINQIIRDKFYNTKQYERIIQQRPEVQDKIQDL